MYVKFKIFGKMSVYFNTSITNFQGKNYRSEGVFYYQLQSGAEQSFLFISFMMSV